jgi:hypothetical protein
MVFLSSILRNQPWGTLVRGKVSRRAINLIRPSTDKKSIKLRRKIARCDPDDLGE